MQREWFKVSMRQAGRTAGQLARAIGRDPAVMSRILSGAQAMTMEQARIIAAELGVDLAQVLQHAGLIERAEAAQLAPGFGESDAAAFIPRENGEDRQIMAAAQLFGARPGVDMWRVKSRAMVLGGLLEGDFLLVDTHAAERVKPGDCVVAQVYGRDNATTVLRRFEPPVLVAASADPAEARVHVVDGVNVVIRGKVVASWRVT